MTAPAIETIMLNAPVIPVIVINDVADAVPMAEALVAGGLKVLEVTLRTPAALEAIAAMKQVEGAIVGAGTVIDPKTLDAALKAGSEFIVSPGLTENLGKAAIESGIPFLPGIANAGDIMRGLDMGLPHFKFFPAICFRTFLFVPEGIVIRSAINASASSPFFFSRDRLRARAQSV